MLVAARIGPGAHVVWPRGVNADAFAPARRASSLRQEWRANDETPVVMYAGRVSREKNLAVLAAVRERLVSVGLPHRLVVVGDGPMRHELERLLPDAILTGSIP